MLEISRTTDALPILTPVRKPSDYRNVEYTASLLLCTPLTFPFVGDPNHHIACRWGFIAYFNDMLDTNADGTGYVFIDRFYSEQEVYAGIDDDINSHEETSLSWCVGFLVGWHSALALIDYALASSGLDYLTMRVQEYRV